MGALCCCLSGNELEDFSHAGNSMHRHCVCLGYLFQQLFSGYGPMFYRLEGRSVPQTQVGTALASTAVGTGLPDSSMSDAHISLSRPAPFDMDQRYTRLQRDGLVSRKTMSHFQEESQPLRRNISGSGIDSLGFAKKRNEVDAEDASKVSHSESSEIALATKVGYGASYLQTSLEDEDVCPTCLDEYTPENPKITTRCSHHFHLGCIYEWLERSESCPICGKEMEFCETP